jgi:hypothetical protein
VASAAARAAKPRPLAAKPSTIAWRRAGDHAVAARLATVAPQRSAGAGAGRTASQTAAPTPRAATADSAITAPRYGARGSRALSSASIVGQRADGSRARPRTRARTIRRGTFAPAGGGTSAPSPMNAMYSNGEVTSPWPTGT